MENCEEGFEFEEYWQDGGGIWGSWEGVEGFSVLVGSWYRSIRPSTARGSVTELWVGDGVAISLVIICDPISDRSGAREDFCGRPVGVCSLWIFFFPGGLVRSVWLRASVRFLVGLRERRMDLLGIDGSFE